MAVLSCVHSSSALTNMAPGARSIMPRHPRRPLDPWSREVRGTLTALAPCTWPQLHSEGRDKARKSVWLFNKGCQKGQARHCLSLSCCSVPSIVEFHLIIILLKARQGHTMDLGNLPRSIRILKLSMTLFWCVFLLVSYNYTRLTPH